MGYNFIPTKSGGVERNTDTQCWGNWYPHTQLMGMKVGTTCLL